MTEPCQQADRIKKLEVSVEIIEEKIDVLGENVQEIVIKLTPFIERVSYHDDLLRGKNGDIGLASKINLNGTKMDEIYALMRGVGDKPGIVGMFVEIQNKMKDSEDSQKWLMRLIAGAVIASILSNLLPLIKP